MALAESSGTGRMLVGAPRRQGSVAARREFHDDIITGVTTSTWSAAPANTAWAASSREKTISGAGRLWCDTSVSPNEETRKGALAAPASAVATTPSISAAVSPASRIAAVAACKASDSGERSPRLKPVEPTPTIAIWSFIGDLAISLGAPGSVCSAGLAGVTGSAGRPLSAHHLYRGSRVRRRHRCLARSTRVRWDHWCLVCSSRVRRRHRCLARSSRIRERFR